MIREHYKDPTTGLIAAKQCEAKCAVQCDPALITRVADCVRVINVDMLPLEGIPRAASLHANSIGTPVLKSDPVAGEMGLALNNQRAGQQQFW